MKTLGNKINEMRKSFSMTQDELAEKMDVFPQAVSKWENDLSVPDIQTLISLADLFGISLDMLLRNDYIEQTTQTERKKDISVKKNINKMSLYIKVHEPDGDDINLKFPMAFAKGKMLKKFTDKYLVPEGIDFDYEQIIEMAENGIMNDIIDITEADGTTVKIYIE